MNLHYETVPLIGRSSSLKEDLLGRGQFAIGLANALIPGPVQKVPFRTLRGMGKREVFCKEHGA